MADDLIVMKDGEIVESGEPVTLYSNPKFLYTAGLLANCNILDQEKADLCGIKTKKEAVTIYPEWLEIDLKKSGNWIINTILFKGFYEDIMIENEETVLRIRNHIIGKYKEGEKVGLKVKKYLEY
jgi:ABC-type Fe3+/spermidine/putrescine transport system ATPase subunit